MMKVSDPVMFGHCVSVYFADAIEKHAGVLEEIGANVNNGLSDVLEKLNRLPENKKSEIEADIVACYEKGADLAIADSRTGKTKLPVPKDRDVCAARPGLSRPTS